MKIDMSPKAITKRLRIVNELRRACLSLADSSAGKEIMKKFSANIGAANRAVTRPLIEVLCPNQMTKEGSHDV